VIGKNTLAHKVVNRVIINHDSLVTSKQLVSFKLVQLLYSWIYVRLLVVLHACCCCHHQG
jgi:hypothetical protein